MAESLAVTLGIATAALSLFTGIVGAIAWNNSRVKKSYAAERDFNHLKRNYEQMTENLKELWRQNDERFDFVDRSLDRIHIHMNISRETLGGHRLGKPDEEK